MKMARIIPVRAAATALAVPTATSAQQPTTLVEAVRQATRAFRDVEQATTAGYGSAGSCVSGPEQGAMGIHYPNGARHPEGVMGRWPPRCGGRTDA